MRARRVQGKGDDSVVKLRPVAPGALPDSCASSPAFGVEVDAMPGGFVCSGSMKHELPRADVRAAVAGERPIHSSSRRSSARSSRPTRRRSAAPPPELFTAATETRAFLTECDVHTSGEQHTKTHRALEFFSRHLA